MQGVTHLITTGTWLKVLVGQIEFFNTERAKVKSCQHNRRTTPAL